MRFLVVFVHEEDVSAAADALREHDFQFTMLNSTSGYLRNSSCTFLLGVAEEQLEECLEIFRAHCKSRMVGAPGSFMEGKRVEEGQYIAKYEPATVEVGGAVAFVLDAEQML